MQARTIQTPDPEQAEARLPLWMAICGGLGAAAGLVSGHGRFAAGFVLGAALGLLNYFWLHQAVQVLFDAGRARVPRLLVVKFLIRYPLAFGGVYLFYRTGWLPFAGILAGLFVPVAGVLIEAVLRIIEGFRCPESPQARP